MTGAKNKTRRRAPRARQMAIEFRTWGGRREGAGRKPRPGRRRVPHTARARLASRYPVHVTTRVRDDVPSLRKRILCEAIRRALIRVTDQPGFRVCQFSVQRDHLHFICEAASAEALSTGMKRLKQIIARGINRRLTPDGRRCRRPASGPRRTGSVFADRYHAEIMTTPRQVRNTLAYVLHNARKHEVALPTLPSGTSTIDPCSSAFWFDGWCDTAWKRGLSPPPDGVACVSPSRTWLLSIGWRRHGLIRTDERPAKPR